MTGNPASFEGRLRPGDTAAEIPVRVEVDGETLVIASAEGARRLGRDGVRADAPLPGVARTITLPDGGQIETDDREAVATLWPSTSGIAAAAYWLESRWAAALAGIPLIAALVWLVVGVLLPRAANPVAAMLSPPVEQAIGRQTLATLDRVALKPSKLDAGAQAGIEEKFRSLIAGEPGEEGYRLVFRGGMGPNAFALPGGTIVMTDAMAKLVPNDAEMVAVLAHEIGHVRGRHALRLVLQDSGVVVLVTALAGDATSMTFLAAALPTVLLQSHYSREFESEADDYAFSQLKRHGYSPQAFADLMRRLRESDRGSGQDSALRYFGTHPLTEERIERAEQAARKN